MARSIERSERVVCCAHDGTRIYRPGYRPPCCARYSTGAVWIACPCSTNAACSRTMSGACTCNSIVSRVACRCGGVTYGATGGRAPHFVEPPIHRSSKLSSSRHRVNHRGAWSRRWTVPGTVDSSTRRIWGRSSVRSRAASGACGTSWIHRQNRDPRRWCGSCSAVSGCGGEHRCRFRTWVGSTSSWRGGSSSNATARPITRPGRLSVRTVVAIAPPQRRVTSPSASSRRRSCTSRRLFVRRSRGSSRGSGADAAAADRTALLRPHAIPASRAQVSTYSASAGFEVVRRPRSSARAGGISHGPGMREVALPAQILQFGAGMVGSPRGGPICRSCAGARTTGGRSAARERRRAGPRAQVVRCAALLQSGAGGGRWRAR